MKLIYSFVFKPKWVVNTCWNVCEIMQSPRAHHCSTEREREKGKKAAWETRISSDLFCTGMCDWCVTPPPPIL